VVTERVKKKRTVETKKNNNWEKGSKLRGKITGATGGRKGILNGGEREKKGRVAKKGGKVQVRKERFRIHQGYALI